MLKSMAVLYRGDEVFLYKDVIFLPMSNPDGTPKRKKNGERMFFKKPVSFEEASNHWTYNKKEGMLYYTNHKDWSKRLVRANLYHETPESIEVMIKLKEVRAQDANEVERYRRKEERYTKKIYEPRIPLVTDWSVIYDGKSVYDFMEDRPKTPYKDLVSVVKNEGGYIDEDGIIHKKPRNSN